MKLTVLLENYTITKGCKSEHGLSVLIECNGNNILFDTGQTDLMLFNAEHLGIDISHVDSVVLSHGHADHTGGLPYFLEKNSKAEVFVKPEIVIPKYKNNTYIGIPKIADEQVQRFRDINRVYEICDNVFVCPNIDVSNNKDTYYANFYVKSNGNMLSDSFRDELFICIVHEKYISILTACSHNGITNICNTAKQLFNKPIHTVIGGFHTHNSTAERQELIVDYFKKESVKRVITGHCTGLEMFSILKQCNEFETTYCSTALEIIL